MLLTGQPLPPDAPDLLHEVAGMLASLAGPAGPGELAGEAAARSAFARVAASPPRVSPADRLPARRRPAWPFTPAKARLAAALAAVAVRPRLARRGKRLIRQHGRGTVMRAFRDAQHICIEPRPEWFVREAWPSPGHRNPVRFGAAASIRLAVVRATAVELLAIWLPVPVGFVAGPW
jgi:hypothetical protein